jgi:hypothetical protein
MYDQWLTALAELLGALLIAVIACQPKKVELGMRYTQGK